MDGKAILFYRSGVIGEDGIFNWIVWCADKCLSNMNGFYQFYLKPISWSIIEQKANEFDQRFNTKHIIKDLKDADKVIDNLLNKLKK